jgi:transcriptional repressor NrdR
MVCIYCGQPTKVTNSRLQKKANQVWRRRQCTVCGAVFTTLEGVDTAQALRVRKNGAYKPFQRDMLLLSVYDSLRHRKTASEDATALTATIMGRLLPKIREAALERDDIVSSSAEVLGRFDKAAATHYSAFHPL